jgi:hypothetical protein
MRVFRSWFRLFVDFSLVREVEVLEVFVSVQAAAPCLAVWRCRSTHYVVLRICVHIYIAVSTASLV